MTKSKNKRTNFRLTEKTFIFLQLFNGNDSLLMDNIPDRHNKIVMMQWLRRDGIITVERANNLSPNSKITKVFLTNKGKEQFLEYFERKAREQNSVRRNRKSKDKTQRGRNSYPENQSNL
jgi:hypothetical protein